MDSYISRRFYAYFLCWRGFLNVFRRNAALLLAQREACLCHVHGWREIGSPNWGSEKIFCPNAIGKTLRRKPQCLLQISPSHTCAWICFSARCNVFMPGDVGDWVALGDGGA